MENKVYEEGMVEITTTEYRDIITEMVENRKDAEFERDKRWKAEAKLKEVKEELLLTQKRVVELEARLADMEYVAKEVAING